MVKKLLLSASLLFIASTEAKAGCTQFTSSTTCVWASSTTWFLKNTQTSFTMPSDWNASSNTIEAIGCGGSTLTGGTGGGGGGAYSKIVNFSTTSNSVSVSVPPGTNGSCTSYTWFGSTSVLAADYGRSTNSTLAGAAGATANCTGTTKFAGGIGGCDCSELGYAGAGGAAGLNGAGGGAFGTDAGGTGDNTKGGTGGTAGIAGGDGTEWLSTPEKFGSGGGSGRNNNGGQYGGGGQSTIKNGGNGLLVISYWPSSTPAATTQCGMNNPFCGMITGD